MHLQNVKQGESAQSSFGVNNNSRKVDEKTIKYIEEQKIDITKKKLEKEL